MKITSDYLLMGSAALVFAAAGILYGAHPGQVRSDSGEQTVTTTDGKTIHVKVAGRVYTADVAGRDTTPSTTVPIQLGIILS